MSFIDKILGGSADSETTDSGEEGESGVQSEASEEKPSWTEYGDQASVNVTAEKTRSHTVHLAVARFADGEDKKFMFDAMKKKEQCIVLCDYTRFTPRGRKTRAKTALPYANLKEFETVRREKVNIVVGEERRNYTMHPINAWDYAQGRMESEYIKSITIDGKEVN